MLVSILIVSWKMNVKLRKQIDH